MEKQYAKVKTEYGECTVIIAENGKIVKYIRIPESSYMGFSLALKNVGYELAYVPEEFEQRYMDAIKKLGAARAAYIRAKENRLKINDDQIQKLQRIMNDDERLNVILPF